MKQNNTFSAFALPGLTAALVSGVITAGSLSFAQDVAVTTEAVKETVETMQLQYDMNPKPETMDRNMKEEFFKKQKMEKDLEMYDSSSGQKNFEMQKKPMHMDQTEQSDMSTKKDTRPVPAYDGEKKYENPSSSSEGMSTSQGQDQRHTGVQHEKKLEKAIKQAEEKLAKMTEKFDKQKAHKEEKYERTVAKMEDRLSKLTDEEKQADMQDKIDEVASKYEDMIEEMTAKYEERSEVIGDIIEHLKEQLAELQESKDTDE